MKKLKLMFGAAAVVGSLVTGTCDAMLPEKEGRAERSALSSMVEDEKSDYEKAVEGLEAVRSESECFESLYQAVTKSDWYTVGNILKTNVCHLVEQGRLKEIGSLMSHMQNVCATDNTVLDYPSILNSTDARERTPLLIALENNNFAAARSLVEWGARVDAPINFVNNSALHVAVVRQDMRFIRLFADAADRRGNINVQNECGLTPLHLAAATRNLEAARVLIDHGANPFIKNGSKKSPLDTVRDKTDFLSQRILRLMENRDEYLRYTRKLMKASKIGDTERLERLMQDPWVTYARLNDNILCTAVENNRKGVVRSLLRHGFNSNVTDSRGIHALQLAVEESNLEIMLMLAGSMPPPLVKDYANKLSEQCGNNILVSSLKARRTSRIRGDIRYTKEYVLNVLANDPGWFIKPGDNGNTPIFSFAMNSEPDVLQLLIDLRLGDEVMNKFGNSPAFIAAPQNIPLFIKAGSGIWSTDKDGDGMWEYVLNRVEDLTPDQLRESIEGLNELGVSVFTVNRKGETLIHCTVSWLSVADETKKDILIDFIRTLADRGVNIDASDKNGLTAVQWAARVGQSEVARALLELGANPIVVDDQGNTLIHNAVKGFDSLLARECPKPARCGFTDTVGGSSPSLQAWISYLPEKMKAAKALIGMYGDFIYTLVEHGVDIDAVNSGGDTAVQLAAREGQSEVARELLELGADASQINEDHVKDPQLREEIRRRKQSRS